MYNFTGSFFNIFNMKISGIYKIQSKKKPNRIYIGSAVIIQRRWNDHYKRLRKGIHDNIKLQRHYNKYGESDFQFSILISCDKDELISIEQFFLDAFNPYFNFIKKAGSCLGYKHTEEAKKNMSIAQRNRNYKASDETKKKMSVSMKGKYKGKKHSIASRKNMSESHKEHYPSVETKVKMKEAQRLRRQKEFKLKYA